MSQTAVISCRNCNDSGLCSDTAGHNRSSTLSPSIHTTQGQRKDVHSVVVPANQGIDDNCITGGTGGTEDTVCGNRSCACNTTDAKCIVGISADNSGNMSSMASASEGRQSSVEL